MPLYILVITKGDLMAESYNPDHVWAPFGAFSMVVLQGTGQVVHLKGQVALDVTGCGAVKNSFRISPVCMKA